VSRELVKLELQQQTLGVELCERNPEQSSVILGLNVSDIDGKPDIVVVVPTRNSEATLRACLNSVRAQSYACTLVVVDNYSVDATRTIADDVADLVITAGPERSAQRNAGASASPESIVGFIDSDMVLTPEVIAEVVGAIKSGATSVVVPEETDGVGFWARVSAYERSFYEGSETIEAPRFFPRRVFQAVGGFDEAMTGAEDWDLGLRTLGFGPRASITAKIIHEEGRVNYFNICRKKAYYAPGVALFIKKHGIRGLTGMSRRAWLRQPRALTRPLGLGLIAMKTGQAIAMAIGIAWTLVGRRTKLPAGPPRT
jgi:glycosyltransferase involved in cell wall biosynthesis